MLIYLVASSGINGSMHYCGGVLASISFDNDNTNKCACGSKEMKKDCCQDTTFYLHIEDGQQKASQVSFDFYKPFDMNAVLVTVSHSPFYELSWTLIRDCISYHPPDNPNPPLYVLNQVFWIWFDVFYLTDIPEYVGKGKLRVSLTVPFNVLTGDYDIFLIAVAGVGYDTSFQRQLLCNKDRMICA